MITSDKMQFDINEGKDVTYTLEKIRYYPFHIRKKLRILYVVRGSIEIRNVSGNINLCAGDIEFININEPAEIVADTEDNLVIIMAIDYDYMKRYEKNIDFTTFNVSATNVMPKKERHTDKKTKELLLLFKDQFAYYCKTGKTDYENLNVMVSLIVKQFNDIVKHFDYLPNPDWHIIERFIDIELYLAQNAFEKVTLTDLANKEFLSPQYVSSEIRKKFDITFSTMIEYYRVKKAVVLIIEKDLKTAQIIKECGFSDDKYYYRALKKHMGCTPADLKRRVEKNRIIITKYIEITPACIELLEKDVAENKENQIVKIPRTLRFESNTKVEMIIPTDSYWFFHRGSSIIILTDKLEYKLGNERDHLPYVYVEKSEIVRIINTGKMDSLVSIMEICTT